MADPSSPMLRHVAQFAVHQRVTPVVNRYEIRAVDGDLLAFAQQKRMKLKEEVLFHPDERRADVLFSFRSRQRIDMRATTDVLDADGGSIGTFSKQFGASLLRSTWTLAYGDVAATGQESSMGVAIVRRVVDLPLRFHFTFADDATGDEVMTVRRGRSIRDRYAVSVPDDRMPFAVAAAMAVALDAFQGR